MSDYHSEERTSQPEEGNPPDSATLGNRSPAASPVWPPPAALGSAGAPGPMSSADPGGAAGSTPASAAGSTPAGAPTASPGAGGPWMGAGPTSPTPPTAPAAGGPWMGAGSTPPPPADPPGGSWALGGGWTPPPSAPPVGVSSSGRKRRALPVALAAALVALATAGGFGVGHALWPGTSSPTASATLPSSGTGNSGSAFGQSPSSGSGSGSSAGSSSGPSDTAAIAAKVDPALVDIVSAFGYQEAEGAGTGIVLTSNGEILTNNHVIDGATKISVTDIGNGKTYSASVVGYDASGDMAVLQLQGASGLKTANLGDSGKAAVGQLVVAIGNAGGTGGTPSSAGGSITALNQSIAAGDDLDGTTEQLSGLIQTNADVQAGDSGGALVNTSGQVIGMDTAASEGFSFQSSGQSSGTQGFAIPINEALSIAKQIESGQGSSTVHVGSTAFLGILISGSSGQSGSSGFGSSSGSSGSSGSTSGVTIGEVVTGGTAQQAGLVAGDVITSLGGQTVDSASAISAALITHHAGDKIQIGWIDSSGQSHTATVTLASGPPA
jgi:S1-C subfamily serine protease